MSGREVFVLIEACLATGSRAVRTRGVHHVRLRSGSCDLPCLVLSMPGPRSYTGEDSAEIQCAGNPALLDRIVESMLERAAKRDLAVRRADPGEFTARAFFHGRLELVQAEGVAATIAARSDAELRAAGMLREGRLGRLATQLADTLGAALALVEAGIDFTDEEDVVAIASPDLLGRLEDLLRRIDDILRRATGMEQFEDIPRVVLRGEPNSGKSTLFNALLGRTRAVVSDRAGTTRDVLAEPLQIATAHGPAEVMLMDLAGAADDESLLGQGMQSVASEALRRAALVLHCVPLGRLRPSLRGHEIVVNTMIDRAEPRTPRFGPSVSATTGQGLDELRALIAGRLADQAVSLDADVLVLRQRHESCLREAKQYLAEAVDLVRLQTDQTQLHHAEFIAASMRSALDELSGLAGRVSPDDLLGRIFSSFCIGK